MKKFLAIFFAFTMIFLVSCSSQKEVTSGDIVNKLSVGMSVDSDLASDIKYEIVDGSVGKATFTYNGHKYTYLGSLKKNYSMLEPSELKKVGGEYIVEKTQFLFKASNAVANDEKLIIVEWLAELSTGAYKCFYVLYTYDIELNEETIEELSTVLVDVINM